jgi:hypothetical protein
MLDQDPNKISDHAQFGRFSCAKSRVLAIANTKKPNFRTRTNFGGSSFRFGFGCFYRFFACFGHCGPFRRMTIRSHAYRES